MDVDIVDILFLALWGLVAIRMFHFKLNKKPAESRREESETDDILTDTLPAEEANESEDVEEGDYDFAALRKKIQESWEADDEEENRTQGMTQEVYREEETPEEEVNPYQAYVDQLRETPKKKEISLEPSPVMTMDSTEDGVWTEKDVRTWITYQAIFGPPRSQKKWKPMEG